MSGTEGSIFMDRTGAALARPLDQWPTIVIRKAEIDREVERLADLPAPANGRREAIIKHPRATAPGYGLAPGIRVTLSVLKPGEATAPFRHNATEVNFCIGGSGVAVVGGRERRFARYDVWNHPSYTIYRHRNDGDELQVRLACFLDRIIVER